MSIHYGQRGLVTTPLEPAGEIAVEGKLIPARVESGTIEFGREVSIEKLVGNVFLVRPLASNESPTLPPLTWEMINTLQPSFSFLERSGLNLSFWLRVIFRSVLPGVISACAFAYFFHDPIVAFVGFVAGLIFFPYLNKAYSFLS